MLSHRQSRLHGYDIQISLKNFCFFCFFSSECALCRIDLYFVQMLSYIITCYNITHQHKYLMESQMSNKFLSTTSAFLLSTSMLVADVPKVTVDIAPVHSLVSSVMEGVGKPDLIMPAGASPHEYQLKPSNAKSLEDADVVFWIGEDLTPWLENGLERGSPPLNFSTPFWDLFLRGTPLREKYPKSNIFHQKIP